MTGKEAILAAVDLQDTERVPAAYYGGGMWTLYQAGETFESLARDPRRMAGVFVRMAEEVGNPMVYCGSGYNNLHVAALGGTIKYRKIGAPDLEEALVHDLAGVRALDTGRMAGHETIQTVWKTTEIVSGRIGDRFVVTTTSWGPFTLAGQICGVEPLMRGTFKAREMVHAVVDFAREFITGFYEPLISRGLIEMVSIADPTASGDLLSRKQFAEFVLPSLRQLTDRWHQKKVKTLLHICGDTTDRLDLLLETGADIISVDHKVDLVKAREAFRGKRCLAGNLDPVAVMLQAGPEQVAQKARDVIQRLGGGGGFILMPGCDIGPTVPRENVEALLRTAAATPPG
ncbi:MAG: uroporphyrinogen decarboxylase family protein [Peptococcaceae bacterium]|jgi:uroporphyrinogen decarboxylase|nr:uroporphyrinogen decarboxylase family protein [Peptococcaceae bacterium]